VSTYERASVRAPAHPRPEARAVAEPPERTADPGAAAAIRWRWVAIAVFSLSAVLNYLDRQLLAAVAPSVMSEYGLTFADYGTLLAAFSMTYLLMAPLAGLIVDRIGLHVSSIVAVGLWSLTSIATGMTSTFGGILACRMGLGFSEAAGIPSSSKASATYLHSREQGLGIAVQSGGITVGTIAAPLLVAALAPSYGWRAVFVVCGIAGLLWLPLWWFTARRIPARAAVSSAAETVSVAAVLRDPRLWGILAANALIMTIHSLWLNWTTVYLVQAHQLTQTDANRYFAWIPPIFATLGGLFGAWLTLRLTAAKLAPLKARLRVCTVVAPVLFVTAAVPLMQSPALAAFAISVSIFACMTMLNNLHIIPIDLFGSERAAFTSALLMASYALIQMVLSPAMGAVVDRYGFGVLCMTVSLCPIVGVVILRMIVSSAPRSPRSQPESGVAPA
jgi:ACS family hexuronate transporter-like MFS transporter